ncbi:MAG: Smr/MutS family protein [Bacteroidales bacterium]|nr:Smr/MutS family protein [Bacteroidales bacterium]
MIHPEKIEPKIGFDKIREMISAKCGTEYGRHRVEEEAFSTNRKEIEHRLSLTDEMRLIQIFESSFPDSGFIDCIPFLIPLQAGYSHIDTISLAKLRDTLETLRKILNFFKNTGEGEYPCLKKMSETIFTFPEVSRRIDTILDRFGEVRDNASDALFEIRRSIREKEGTISRRIQAILRKAQEDGVAEEDASVSVRDGRMLIPVAVGNKKKIPGFVYDESASGKTAFVEPMEIVELNNQVRELHFAEQREIVRILTEFTEFLRPYLPEIIASAEYMGELDFISAKAMVASRFAAGKPVISVSGEVRLQRARHPLLEENLKREGKKIVPLDLQLNPDKRILLISGPNAGGKSVCLKTVGLLQYMMQWGMLITTAESSELPVFKDIFIDIGDNQSIENDLSTYSSHLLNMKNILDEAGDRSLVLIDEFGSGTEPAAGGAIAEEILSELERRGCYGVITTHYTNLKFYAGNSTGVINGAMLFDVQKIEPLFKLEMGLPGNSFAFELARKMGLPESIVHGAEERAGSDFVTIERNLRKIARNKKQLEERLAKIKSTDKTLENITEKYEKELGDIKSVRKGIIEEAKREAQEILAQANKKIEATIKEIKESQAEKEKTKVARKSLTLFQEELTSGAKSKTDEDIDRKMAQIIERKKRQQERKEQREKKRGGQDSAAEAKEVIKEVQEQKEAAQIVVGGKVKVKGSELVGEVVKVSGKSISVAIGEIITKMSIDKVEGISGKQYKDHFKPAERKSVYSGSSISERRLNFNPNIDIRGKRLDEAIEIVTRFIDDAIMVDMGQVSILHGKGNGVLREEIRKYLKITPGVKSFRDEHIERGGTGITIVELDK